MADTFVDFSFSHPSPWEIVNAGHKGVARYIGWDFGHGPRCISAVEYQAYRDAGLGVMLVWETNADMVLRGAPGGDADGAEAARLCAILGHNRPVPVAYDFDIQGGQYAVADAYEAAFAAHFPQSRYGKYDVIERKQGGWQCCAWSPFRDGSGGRIQGRAVSQFAVAYQKLGYVMNNRCDENDILKADWFQHNYDGATDAAPAPLPVEQVAPQHPDVTEGTTIEVQTDLTFLAQHVPDGALDPQGVDGNYGDLTRAAVIHFQQTHTDVTGAPLVADGQVGPLTMTSLRVNVYFYAAEAASQQPADEPVPTPVPLNPNMPALERLITLTNPHMAGEDVRLWQEHVYTPESDGGRGYLVNGAPGTADGDFGDESFNTLKEIQRDLGLDEDGLLGHDTWVASWNP